MKTCVLIADDDEAIGLVLERAMHRAGYTTARFSDADALREAIAQGEGKVALLDAYMHGSDTFGLLAQIRGLRPDFPVIMMSARNSLTTAVRAMESGAFDYQPKPFDLNTITALIARAVSAQTQPTDKESLLPPGFEDETLIGSSQSMQAIYRTVARLASSDLSVLIEGPSGTGKELIARALHRHGPRSQGAFIALNMAAMPGDLIETELFGHEKGAFTGAHARKQGHFAAAEGGTLFLDEIGDMPLRAQTRLLRVLQEGEFTPVGGTKTRKTDVRIIAATHQNLTALIASGRFRDDLYYRLNVVPIVVPSLEERRSDIPALVAFFLRREARRVGRTCTIEPSAVERLQGATWKGNVRELENTLRRLVALSPERVITSEAVKAALERAEPHAPGRWQETAKPESAPSNFDTSYLDAFSRRLDELFSSGRAVEPGLYHRLLKDWESRLFSATLKSTGQNRIKAAELLGINRNTLRRKHAQAEESPADGESEKMK